MSKQHNWLSKINLNKKADFKQVLQQTASPALNNNHWFKGRFFSQATEGSMLQSRRAPNLGGFGIRDPGSQTNCWSPWMSQWYLVFVSMLLGFGFVWSYVVLSCFMMWNWCYKLYVVSFEHDSKHNHRWNGVQSEALQKSQALSGRQVKAGLGLTGGTPARAQSSLSQLSHKSVV